MKNYKILEFKVNNGGNATWVLDQTSGHYKLSGDSRDELDLLYNRSIIISKVEDLSRPGKIFKIGDLLGPSTSITCFEFRNNNLYLVCNTHSLRALSAANLYVEPVAEPRNYKTVLKELETKLLRERPLQLGNNSSNTFTNPNQTLEEFLFNFFGNYNPNYNTCYSDGERASEQTPAGKRRSLSDIFLICRKYYPTCSLRDVIQYLYVDVFVKIPHLRTLKCFVISKRVWWIAGEHAGVDKIKHTTISDEFGFIFDEYKQMLAATPKVAVEAPKATSKFEEAKAKYTVGKRVRSQMGGTAFTIDSKVFDESINYIFNISKAGTRRVLYNKNNDNWSVIS